ncbi:hypothetical protein PR048_022290, partial [Dryococelus australis]
MAVAAALTSQFHEYLVHVQLNRVTTELRLACLKEDNDQRYAQYEHCEPDIDNQLCCARLVVCTCQLYSDGCNEVAHFADMHFVYDSAIDCSRAHFIADVPATSPGASADRFIAGEEDRKPCVDHKGASAIEDDFLEVVCNAPSTSTYTCSRFANDVMVSHTTVGCILHKQLLLPYHAYDICDYPRRLQFSCYVWFWQQYTMTPHFGKLALFIYDATIAQNGSFNEKKSSCYVEFSINVWCDNIDDHLEGPTVFGNRLTETLYDQFLFEECASTNSRLDTHARSPSCSHSLAVTCNTGANARRPSGVASRTPALVNLTSIPTSRGGTGMAGVGSAPSFLKTFGNPPLAASISPAAPITRARGSLPSAPLACTCSVFVRRGLGGRELVKKALNATWRRRSGQRNGDIASARSSRSQSQSGYAHIERIAAPFPPLCGCLLCDRAEDEATVTPCHAEV